MLPTALKLPTAVGMPFPSKDRSPSGWVSRGATLDLDFLNDRSSVGGVERSAFAPLSFARSTVASYYDVNGVLQWAAINTPRIDYHPLSHKKLGFLSEQAIGNYCRQSNDFAQAVWTKGNVTLTAAASVGPDGLMSMTRVEAATSASTLLYNSCPSAGNASGNTASVYAKKGSGATDANRFLLRNETTSTDLAFCTLNYDTGVLTITSGSAVVQELPGGIYRVSVTSLTGISSNDTLRLYVGFSGATETAGEFAYFCFSQVERQVMATSYFPSDATVATRGSDNLDIACSAFGYNAQAGTLLGKFKSFQGSTTGGSVNGGCGFYLAGDTDLERLYLFYYGQVGATPPTRMGGAGRVGNVAQWDRIAFCPPDTFSRTVMAWKQDDIAFSSGGSALIFDTLATIPQMDRFAVGRGLSASQYLNGHVARVTYWPNRRSNEEILALSAAIDEASIEDLLFSNGERGFIIDFSELDELFTTYDALANVAADGDPIGFALDDSSWGGKTYSQAIAPRPNIAPAFVVGGTGWTVAGGDGTHVITFGADSMRYQSDTTSPVLSLSKPLTLIVGRFYEIITTVTGYVSGSLKIDAFNGASVTVATGLGVKKTVFQALGTTLQIIRNSTNVDITLSSLSIREVPGNPVIQSQNTVNRPLRRTNSGAPCAQYDGVNDSLISQFYPFASGSGLTMAAAFKSTNVDNAFIGGGNVTMEKRALIGMSSGGQMTVHWGTAVNETITVDRRNFNHVMIVTGDSTGRDVWLDGQNITSLFAAPVGSPDSTGGALTIGARQNTVGGGPDRPFAGDMFKDVVLDRRLLPSEVAALTADLNRYFGTNLWNDAVVTFTGESSKLAPRSYRIYSSAGALTEVVGGSTALIVGRQYDVEFTIDSIAVQGNGIKVGGNGAVFNTTGLKQTVYTADSTSAYIKRNTNTVDYTISNVSFKLRPL